MRPDGRLVTRLSTLPVNFEDAHGRWQPIDNQLVGAGKLDQAQGYAFENKANSYRAFLPRDLATPVRVAADGSWVSFRLEGAAAGGAATDTAARYEGVLPGVDAEYAATNTALKETLTLAGPGAPTRFLYRVHTSADLRARSRRGGIEFVDRRGRVVFGFSAPFAYDHAQGPGNLTSRPVSLALHHQANADEVVLGVDRSWLDARGREWPVTIDPSIYHIDTSTDAQLRQAGANQDCYIKDGSGADIETCEGPELHLGWDGTTQRRAMAQFDVQNSLPKNIKVLDADFGLYLNDTVGTSPVTVNVHRMTRSWNVGATWNRYDGVNAWTTAGGDYDSTVAASTTVNGSIGDWYHWHPRSLVQSWVDRSVSNYGLLVKFATEHVTSNRFWFASSYGSISTTPYLDVVYVPYTGERPYFTIDKQKIDDRMDLGVNVASGNLFLHANDANIAGIGQGLSLDRYYNSQLERNTGFGHESWSFGSGADVSLRFTSTEAIFHGPSGYVVSFPKSGSTWTTPPGMNATLCQVNGTTCKGTSTYALTFDRDQQKLNFNSSGQLVSEQDRNQNRISYSYDTSGKLTTITDTRNRSLTVSYNTAGLISTVTDAAGSRTWQYGYDTSNRLTTYTDPAGKITTYGYTGSDSEPTQITDPRGNITKIGYDSTALGRVTSIIRVTDPVAGTGPTTGYHYNATVDSACASGTFGETVVTDPNGHDTTYCYDDQMRVTRVKDARGKSRDTKWTPNSDADTLTSASQQATSFTFDTDNRQKTVQQPAKTTGGTGLQSQFGYDSSITDKSDPRYQLPTTATDTQQNQLTYGYDGSGNVTSVTDQHGTSNNQLKITRRTDGQIDDVTEPNDQGSSPTTDLVYSTDGKALLTKIDRPAPLGDDLFTYDTLSRPDLLTDGRGKTADYDFDKLDRLTKVTYGDASSVQYGYDDNGNLTSRTDSTGQTTYTYDKLNRLATENFPGGRQNTYTYDNAGNLKTFQDLGGTTTYNYGVSNLLDSMQSPGDPAAVTFGYDDDNRRTATDYPTTGSNKVRMKADYDNPGRLTEIKAQRLDSSNNVLATLTDFTYDYTTVPTTCGGSTGTETNLRQKVTDVVASKATTYCYDKLNRLVKAAESPGDSYAYTYDGNGNITKRTKNTTDTSYGFNQANELCWSVAASQSSSACSPTPSGATTYTFDSAGNMTGSSAGLALAYSNNARNQTTSMNQLTGGTATALGYAGPNQVERTTVGSTTHNNGAFGVSADTVGSTTTTYRRDNQGQLISLRSGTGSPHYYLLDGLGSIAGLTDTSGAKSRSYTYDPYGSTTDNGGTSPANPWRYAGTYQDPTGFYKMGARYYAPALMRWSQADSLDQTGDITQGNLYGYAKDDPSNAIDPSGQQVPPNISIQIQIGEQVTGASSRAETVAGAYARGCVYGAAKSFARTRAVGSAGTGCLSGAVQVNSTVQRAERGIKRAVHDFTCYFDQPYGCVD